MCCSPLLRWFYTIHPRSVKRKLTSTTQKDIKSPRKQNSLRRHSEKQQPCKPLVSAEPVSGQFPFHHSSHFRLSFADFSEGPAVIAQKYPEGQFSTPSTRKKTGNSVRASSSKDSLYVKKITNPIPCLRETRPSRCRKTSSRTR